VSSVLVDTSVWRHFFAGTIAVAAGRAFGDLLDQDDGVLCHPAVIGELVLGGLSIREEALLARLPLAAEVASAEVLTLVRARKLARKGLGWVDCQLLGSVLVTRCRLWSLDRALARAATGLGAGYMLGET
jgi:predicted nucleic acid-binding protein